MARLPYADPAAPATRELVTRIEAERGKVLNLYAMLLNSPSIAKGWLAYLTAVRQQSSLTARMRELVILRVAVLNEAEYEFSQHVPFALKAGFSAAQLERLRDREPAGFAPSEQAVIAYCDAMTRDIRVPDSVFEALRPHFSVQELVEITATVGAYNMVSRFLEALQVDHES